MNTIESLINHFVRIAEKKSNLLDKLPTNWREELKKIQASHATAISELLRLYPKSVDDTLRETIDIIHDAILCDAEPLPAGYTAIILDSTFCPIHGWYRTIALVNGEHLISVNTCNQAQHGRVFK